MLSTELRYRHRCPSPKPVNGLKHEAACLPWTVETDADGQMKKQCLAWSWSLTLPPQGPIGGIIYALNGEHTGTRVAVTTDGETEASKKGHARATQPSLQGGPEQKSSISALYPSPPPATPCVAALLQAQVTHGFSVQGVQSTRHHTPPNPGWYWVPPAVPSDPALYDILLPSTVTQVSRK